MHVSSGLRLRVKRVTGAVGPGYADRRVGRVSYLLGTRGLAIGNEVELIHLHPDEPKECCLDCRVSRLEVRRDARACLEVLSLLFLSQ